ncbi:Phytanoyl-CoA dioxygenase [hydrothermal vent metagenome]|uniref:Phytanoyl-CoA dioxygenase n=1 Tax=hydrothermal vent metagenome TaxID=652676 RepID=A0A3B1DH14_9ZZZZ
MTNDLSLKHELINDLFTMPQTEEEWEPFRLSDEQVNFYHEQGYLAGVRILTEAQVEVLREELSVLTKPDHQGKEYWYEYHSDQSEDSNKTLFHALGAWRLSPGLHDIIWSPAFTMAASQLLGGAVRFWHDQLFCKPAQHGGVVAWHQDYSYWTRTIPMQHLTCWIGLDDSTTENGCLHYVPKSHTWDLLPITGLAGDMNAIKEVLSDDQWKQFQKPVAIELKKGECAFHHPLMMHGSYENKSHRPRRAIVLNTFKDGTISDSNEELLAGVPVVPQGKKMEGQFFPLLKS